MYNMEEQIDLVINSLQHIGIPVTNLRRSVTFYEKLGFANVMEAPFELHGEPGTAVMMKRNDIIIELYQMPEPELTGICNRNDGHVDHIAFDVPDIDQAFELLKKAGMKVLEPAPVFLKFWEKGCRYFNIEGPDGERLEFNQIL